MKSDELRKKISEVETLEEYIKAYDNLWNHTIDASPFGIQRQTERRMIEELKSLL